LGRSTIPTEFRADFSGGGFCPYILLDKADHVIRPEIASV